MKLIKMEYKGYEFEINPDSLRVENTKGLASQTVLDYFDKLNFVSFKPSVVSGKGILTGEDMFESVVLIKKIFDEKTSDYLYLPGFSPIKVFFSEFNYSVDSKDNFIKYSLRFVEDSTCKEYKYSFGYTLAKAGENMFDVANRLNINIETLVKNNDFEDLFSLCEGDKVYYA